MAQRAGIALALQAVIGFVALEWAWSQLRRFREVDEERDSKFPAFRRRDAGKWQKWKFYPGAMLSMPFRLTLMVI